MTKEINDPRYPSFMGIRKANRATIPAVKFADLGVSGTGATEWTNIRKPEERKTKVVMIDGSSVEEKDTGTNPRSGEAMLPDMRSDAA